MDILIFIAGLVFGAVVMRLLVRRSEPRAAVAEPATSPDAGMPAAVTSSATGGAEQRLEALRREVESQDDQIQQPRDLLQRPAFDEGAALLASDAVSDDDVFGHLCGPGYVLPSMAAVALSKRGDADLERILTALPQLGAYPLSFVLDVLQARSDAASLPRVLAHAQQWWWDYVGFRNRFRSYLQWAMQHPPRDWESLRLDDLDEAGIETARDVLSRFREPGLSRFLAELDDELGKRRRQRVLAQIGRVGVRPPARPWIVHEVVADQRDRLHAALSGERAKSALLLGEPGVGKTVLGDLLVERLEAEGWLVFEASAAEILAGQSYIGELEGRLRELLAVLNRPRTLWRVRDFADMLHKGSHSRDPRGILDVIVPAIERGDLLLLGEVTPVQLAKLLVARPMLKDVFEILPVDAPDAAAMHDIAARWAVDAQAQTGCAVADADLLGEAARVAAHYFPEKQEPGRLLRLLDAALQLATSQAPVRLPLDGEHLLAAVAARSGLPLEVLDERESLDLGRLRAFFRARVLGQDEAVEALIDRIALLKAGLVDGRRPVGVFLFAGPTGTGKTELAKALGELLFGSSERLLRLDMSEFRAPDAGQRLLADGGEHDTTRSLASRIREQPFSVVLLDEFEKAHPNVWDLFLQVFDDGRLTDHAGNTADFRHAIIILTSNAGATIGRDAGPGFTAAAAGYSRRAVEKALHETFRREFLNRLDRIVLFNPLDRGLMREILHKELDLVLTRRGLRNRGWAVEWEPSAIEFLLDRGFTLDLGARPLRRAIEHHLLAPLARSIVEHRAPRGDQFLFVRSAGEALDVEFVDPDAPAASASPTVEAKTPGDMRAIVYAATEQDVDPAPLRAAMAAIASDLAAAAWSEARDRDYATMGGAEFWDVPSRHAVLDRIERRERIEHAWEAAQRLDARPDDDPHRHAKLAQLLFLLRIAIEDLREERPQDALLAIGVSETERARHPDDARRWGERLLAMYRRWGERRNMRIDALPQCPKDCVAWLAVSGFGALRLLEGERGLHVLELDGGEERPRRVHATVDVQPDFPGRPRRYAPPDAHPRVCRRYRELPSPLVRDTMRGWRTGRLDRVLGGEFDVIP